MICGGKRPSAAINQLKSLNMVYNVITYSEGKITDGIIDVLERNYPGILENTRLYSYAFFLFNVGAKVKYR